MQYLVFGQHIRVVGELKKPNTLVQEHKDGAEEPVTDHLKIYSGVHELSQ